MYRKSDLGWLKHWDFILLDSLCLQISFIIAYSVRNGLGLPYGNELYRGMAVILLLIQIAVTFFGESFKNVIKRGHYQEFIETLKHVCLVTLGAVLFLFITQNGDAFSRITLSVTAVAYLLLAYIGRELLKRQLKTSVAENSGKRSLVIFTTKSMADTVVENILGNNYEGFLVAGIALLDGDEQIGTQYRGIPVVADAKTVAEYVCREWVDEVFVDLPSEVKLPREILNDFIEMGVVVHLRLVEATKLSGQKRYVERMGKYTVLTTCINVANWKQAFMKRALDILGGLVGCLITAVLFIFVAPCIYIQSPGPIFFSQVRVGKNGKRFKIYKFRSMYMDAEARKAELMKQNRVQGGLMFKMENDPRIIGGEKGIGGIIRNYSIDEFPQFWNVLKGDMSLVGTRPPTLDEWVKYDLHHRVRLAAKPGITGMWQVSGRSSITDFEEVVKLDKYYITNWTLGLDIKILFQTVAAVFLKKGAM